MMSTNLTSHSFKVVTCNKSFLFHFESGYQSKIFRVVLSGTLDEYVPRNSGVYMVLRNSSSAPEFVLKGTGGFYQRKNPNVQITGLKREWVADA